MTEQPKTPYDARAIANRVLSFAREKRTSLTQMQLLKILYFANGWYLATHNRKLIEQDFQAWEYGPVIRVVRDSFKDFGSGPITREAERLDIFTGELVPVDPVSDEKTCAFLKTVFDHYHVFDGWELSDMTHEQGSPWDQVWNSERPIGRLGLKISEDSIKRHFLNMRQEQSLN